MEIQYGKQISLTDLINIDIDLFLCAENHENRSFTLYQELSKENHIKEAIVFCYKEEVLHDKKEGFEKHLVKTHDHIYTVVDKVFGHFTNEDLKIVIDYSCMTKSWFYSLLLYFKNKKNKFKSITTYFCYTPAKFEKPKAPKPNKDIGPLPGKYVVPTDKPKALIVCLGYEENKAQGIIEHLDPKKYFLFYTNPASDANFVNVLRESNKNLLNDDNIDCIIQYPFNDLVSLEQKLTQLYYKLKDQFSIIIAPLGPKPFSFISMVMSVKYSDIDIWRVGSGYDINEYSNSPINTDDFIICELFFENFDYID